jgi:hypothetical protein
MLKNMLLVSLRLEVDDIHFLKSIKLKDWGSFKLTLIKRICSANSNFY